MHFGSVNRTYFFQVLSSASMAFHMLVVLVHKASNNEALHKVIPHVLGHLDILCGFNPLKLLSRWEWPPVPICRDRVALQVSFREEWVHQLPKGRNKLARSVRTVSKHYLLQQEAPMSCSGKGVWLGCIGILAWECLGSALYSDIMFSHL